VPQTKRARNGIGRNSMEFDSPRLLELLRSPAEDLAFEIKEWLDLGNNAHKARLALSIGGSGQGFRHRRAPRK
jgi:hypothetical protein